MDPRGNTRRGTKRRRSFNNNNSNSNSNYSNNGSNNNNNVVQPLAKRHKGVFDEFAAALSASLTGVNNHAAAAGGGGGRSNKNNNSNTNSNNNNGDNSNNNNGDNSNNNNGDNNSIAALVARRTDAAIAAALAAAAAGGGGGGGNNNAAAAAGGGGGGGAAARGRNSVFGNYNSNSNSYNSNSYKTHNEDIFTASGTFQEYFTEILQGKFVPKSADTITKIVYGYFDKAGGYKRAFPYLGADIHYDSNEVLLKFLSTKDKSVPEMTTQDLIQYGENFINLEYSEEGWEQFLKFMGSFENMQQRIEENNAQAGGKRRSRRATRKLKRKSRRRAH
jgi:hypothetical protein